MKKSLYYGLFIKDKLVSLMSYSSNGKINYIINHNKILTKNAFLKFKKCLPKHISWSLDLRYESLSHLTTYGFRVESIKQSYQWTDHLQRFTKNYSNRVDLYRIFDAGQALLLLGA